MPSLPVDPKLFVSFVGVMAVMAITPGPANLFAVATGAQRGRASALLSVLGMNLATLVWFGAAALGLATLVTAFPQVFRFIAVLGALYVAWLGLKSIISALRARGTSPDLASSSPLGTPSPSGALRDGFMVQIANPKAILFFTAVLPPFLDIKRAIVPQLGLIAVTTISLDLMAMSAYALGGVALATRMSQPRFQRGFGLFVGGLLLLVAVLMTVRLFD
jgi:threonine/homoserine/homoserine lactone efflux protein